ncbi:hypothetical protein FQN54_007329 [Arachnomyces sp. PD_36]|nr:hypothetical protein FQN54_007329 [Arachnomyces sp. PD_36]
MEKSAGRADPSCPSQSNPSIQIDGAFNVRGLGGYPSTISPKAAIREGIIYRSGHLSDVTSAGWDSFRAMGVSTVIDLTSPGEVEVFTGEMDKTFSPAGIETLHLPFKQGVFSMERQVLKYQQYRTAGPEAIARGYMGLLEVGAAVIKRILEHFRDNPQGACLIHCAMGKDRTGVIIALLLSLAGVPNDIIQDEFSLSEPHLEHLQPRIADIVRSIDPGEDNRFEIARLATECRKDVMGITLQLIEEKYGGIGQYAQDNCGLSSSDINLIKESLLAL